MSVAEGLNEEQRRAVERRDGPMLLAAGAGSGKTRVLVERFVADVLESREDPGADPIPVDGILAITFTRLAAAELVERIRELFLERGEAELAAEVEGAWVMTFDAYCARLLRSEAALAGLDPDFAVIDEAQEMAIREAAWASALAGVLGEPGLRDGMVAALVSTDEQQLREAVEAFHRGRRSAGEALPALPPTPEPDMERACREMGEAAEAFSALLAGAKPGKTVDAARETVALCLQELGEPGSLTAAHGGRWRPNKGGNLFKEPAALAYYEQLEAFTKAAAEYELGPQVAALRELVAAYGREYEEIKGREGGLDFADLAIGAAALLEENPAVAAEQRRRFRRVLVDEFQDTNALQIRLLDALGVGDLFMVGDDLQSIYGFRDADVEIFRRRFEIHREAGETERLSLNYRSTGEVLAFINAGIGPLHREAFEPLLAAGEPGPLRIPLPDLPEGASCELLLVNSAWNDFDELPEGLMDRFPAGTRADQAVEALAVAERIAGLVEAGECEPGEVAVLVRAIASIEPVVRALGRAGIPAVAGSLRGWWEQPEVADLVAYLRLLANPEDQQALYETLASPLVGAGTDALLLIARDRREEGGSLASTLDRAALGVGAAADMAQADRARLAAFAELFAGEREQAPWCAPSVLLERVVGKTGFDAAVAAGPQGPEALLRMRRLIRLAHEFEARGSSDLRRFVDHLARHREEDTRMSEAPPGEADGAVTVMTMHAAKGLQFPVVAVAALGRRPAARTPALLADGERVGLKLKDGAGESRKLFGFDELDQARQAREMEEECRLLHVAATRAERRLLLSGSVALRKNDESWTAAQTIGRPPIIWAGATMLEGTGLDGKEAFLELDEEVVAVGSGEWSAPLRVRAIHPGDEAAGRLAALNLTAQAGGDGGEPRVVELDAPPPPPGPGTVSYSSLASYGRCGYRWYLERVLQLPAGSGRAAGSGEQARARGQAVHALLERAGLGPGDPLPDAAEARAVAEACGYEADDGEIEGLLEMVAAAASSPIAGRLAGSRRELPFTVLLGDDERAPLLTGVIDALSEEPGLPAMVVDYKTDRLGPGREIEADAEERYGVQRAAYALAVLESGGCEEVEVVHLFLERPGEPVSALFGASDVPELRARLLAAAEGLMAGDFEPAAEPWAGLCGDCPGRGGLCPVPVELTDRKRPG